MIAPSVPALAGYAVRSFFWRIERQRKMIEHLEDEVRDELASSRHGQTRAVAVMQVNGDRLPNYFNSYQFTRHLPPPVQALQ